MSFDFAAAMRRATRSVFAQDPMKATRIIQEALSGGGKGREADTSPPPPSAARASASPRRRQGLGEVVRTLAGIRRSNGARPASAPDAAEKLTVPAGASFQARSFACPAGTRRYRLYVPAGAGAGVDEAGGLRGLVVMLHGCKQTPEDFALGTAMNAAAEANRMLVAYPGQTGAHNALSCWNWFNPADQGRGAGEPAIIAGLAEELVAEFGLTRERVFVAGLSAGGAMAAVMGETYPDLFAGVGVHSGLPYGAANDAMSAFAAMRGEAGRAPAPAAQGRGTTTGPRVIVFHGSADATVHPSNAERLVEAARVRTMAEGPRLEQGERGGRRYTRGVWARPDGSPAVERWLVEGAGHAWSGGDAEGSYSDAAGPDASAEMLRFFLQERA